jgi:hypothetical protein
MPRKTSRTSPRPLRLAELLDTGDPGNAFLAAFSEVVARCYELDREPDKPKTRVNGQHLPAAIRNGEGARPEREKHPLKGPAAKRSRLRK